MQRSPQGRRDLQGSRMRGSHLRGNDGGSSKRPIWQCLASFTPSRWLAMRPEWPRLALRSLVRGGSAWPYFRLRWSRHEWPGVAKLLIRLHSVAFGCFSYPPNPHPNPLPEGEGIIQGAGMRGSRLRGNDGEIRVNDVCEQCSKRRRDGAMGVCRLDARFPSSRGTTGDCLTHPCPLHRLRGNLPACVQGYGGVMAETCVGAVFVGAERPLELQEFAVPDVGPDNVLLKMSMAAVCGTDAHNWYNPNAAAPSSGAMRISGWWPSSARMSWWIRWARRSARATACCSIPRLAGTATTA